MLRRAYYTNIGERRRSTNVASKTVQFHASELAKHILNAETEARENYYSHRSSVLEFLYIKLNIIFINKRI